MDRSAGARIVEGLIQKYGCLPAVGDGPILETFHAQQMSKAILGEIERAKDYGWTKITVHMDLPDAKRFAKFLQKAKVS